MDDRYRPEHRKAEEAFARRIEAATALYLQPTTGYCPFDYFAADTIGNLRALIEVKVRGTTSDQYATEIVRADKLVDLLQLSQPFGGIPVILAIAHSDGIDRVANICALDWSRIHWHNASQPSDRPSDRVDGVARYAMHGEIPNELFRVLKVPPLETRGIDLAS